MLGTEAFSTPLPASSRTWSQSSTVVPPRSGSMTALSAESTWLTGMRCARAQTANAPSASWNGGCCACRARTASAQVRWTSSNSRPRSSYFSREENGVALDAFVSKRF